MASKSRSILTIATGKKLYVDMATNLAMSFLLWNDNSKIKFLLVTDHPEFVPAKVRDKIEIIKIKSDEVGVGFSSKLSMEKFIQTDQTLFIDADCLVYGNLEKVFDIFDGFDVSVVGYKRKEGIDIGFCKDISEVLKRLALDYYIMLCGSVYYLAKTDLAHSIFEYAIGLLKNYDELGLIRLRNRENEEPLIALGMAKFCQDPVEDNGEIKADRMYYQYMQNNVLKGTAHLWNDELPVPEYSKLYAADPLIVHFNASFSENYEYESEVLRLRMHFLKGRSKTYANLSANLLSVVPGKLTFKFKETFRPVYRALLGYRKVKASERIV